MDLFPTNGILLGHSLRRLTGRIITADLSRVYAPIF
jgi:hypothetical protein